MKVILVRGSGRSKNLGCICSAAFLVSVPVFLEAPLVRQISRDQPVIYGDLGGSESSFAQASSDPNLGRFAPRFSWSWLAGAIYWVGFGGSQDSHSIEAIRLTCAAWCLWRGIAKIGHLFYLGSLLGTAITDLYIYLVGLVDHWKQLMQVDPALAMPILQTSDPPSPQSLGYGLGSRARKFVIWPWV